MESFEKVSAVFDTFTRVSSDVAISVNQRGKTYLVCDNNSQEPLPNVAGEYDERSEVDFFPQSGVLKEGVVAGVAYSLSTHHLDGRCGLYLTLTSRLQVSLRDFIYTGLFIASRKGFKNVSVLVGAPMTANICSEEQIAAMVDDVLSGVRMFLNEDTTVEHITLVVDILSLRGATVYDMLCRKISNVF